MMNISITDGALTGNIGVELWWRWIHSWGTHHDECMLKGFAFGCMKFLLPKFICRHFWPGLMAGAEIWVHSPHRINVISCLEKNRNVLWG
jgi:hypothetical protein